MISVYINYPNPHFAAAVGIPARERSRHGEPNRLVVITGDSMEFQLDRFRRQEFDFRAEAEFNDMWLEIDLGELADEIRVLRKIQRLLGERYAPLAAAEIKFVRETKSKVAVQDSPEGFTPAEETIAKSRRLYEWLVNESGVLSGRVDRITYKEAAERALGAHWRPMKFYLHIIQDECRARGWPTITVFVVQSGDGLPSSGCDATITDTIELTRAQCRAKTDWPAKAWW